MGSILGLFILFIVASVVIGITVSVKLARKADEAWGRTARTLGFDRAPSGIFRRPSMHGSVHGCRVVVDTYTRSSGKSSTTYTRFRVGHPRPLDLEFTLTKQGFFSGLVRAFGAQDIEVGDPAFDDAVVVKGRDALAVQEWLTQDRRRTILDLLVAYAGVTVSDEHIEWSRRGVIRDADLLTATVEELSSAAVLLAGVEAGEAAAAAPSPRPPAPPEPPEPPRMPAPVPSPLPDPAPEPVPDPVPDPIPEARPDPVTPGATGVDPAARPPVDVDALCRTLFGDGVSTFEAGKRFDAEFRDRPVRGTGTLLSTGSFTYDFVLGRDGAKAVVEVYRVPSPWKKEGEPVVVEIGLPAGTEEAWAGRAGKPVAFRGRLGKVDALMKKFHVLEGELVDA